MAAVREPLLLLTHDDMLARRWEVLGDEFALARGKAPAALDAWRAQGRRLVLLDTQLPGLPRFGDAGWPRRLDGLAVLAAFGNPNDREGAQAIEAGAGGFCHLYAPLDTVRQALRVVGAGELWVGRALLARLLRLLDKRAPGPAPAAPPPGVPERRTAAWAEGLTERERQVAEAASMGTATDAIAEALAITPRTVKAHLSAVFEKLGVADRLQLALRVHGIR